MIAEYYIQSQKCDCYHSGTDYTRCGTYTYASCLKYLDDNGIIVEMPSQAVAPLNIDDTAINTVHEEDLCEKGLLRYRKLWGKNEADIFVNGDIFTGIPIITDNNMLRIDNGSRSYSIPIEKIECIRTTGG